jgi:hypothetical protein
VTVSLYESQGIPTAVLNPLLKIFKRSGVNVPESAYLLAKFEKQVLHQRTVIETVYRWPPDTTDLRQVAYRRLEPVVGELLAEIGTSQRVRARR